MSPQKQLFFILLVTVLAILAACGQAQPTETPSAEPTTSDAVLVSTATPPEQSSEPGYPGASVDSAYPGASSSLSPGDGQSEAAYPGPSIALPAGGDKGPNFQLLPAKAGDTIVSGQSPYNLSLAIVDITLGGGVLGMGQSGADGSFSINVSPLVGGHRIGVTVASSAGQSMQEIALELFEYRGENFVNVPNIGVYFDTFLVEE